MIPQIIAWLPVKKARYTNNVVSTNCERILLTLLLIPRLEIFARIRENIVISSKSETAKAMMKENLQTMNKFQINADKLPTEVQTILLADSK